MIVKKEFTHLHFSECVKTIPYITILFFLLCSNYGIAQQESFPFRKDSALRIVSPERLTLEEVFANINAYHPKLVGAQLGIDNAQAQVKRAYGTLDPRLDAEVTAKRETEKFKQQTAEAQVTVPLYWGQKVFAGWKRNLGFFDQDYTTPLSGEASVGIAVPLWRNIMIDKNRSQILKAEVQPDIAEKELIQIRNELFKKASEKYWDWVGAYKKFEINNRVLQLSLVRAEGINEQIRHGERPLIDSVENYQEIQRRLGALIKARRTYEKMSISFQLFLWGKDGTPADIPDNVIPPDFPNVTILPAEQYKQDRIGALTRRPEIALNRAERKLADISRDFANEQWKPDITLKFAPFSERLNESLTNRLDYKIGVDFSMPLLFRDAGGQLAEAEIKQQATDIKLLLMQRDVQAEVDDAASELLANFEQYQVARNERIAAEKLEEAERELFTRGESDIFRVNFRERFTAQAAEKEVDALTDYFEAIARYRWAAALF